MKSLSCTNRECPLSGKAASGRIVRHGFYRTRWGRRRRYRCRECGQTFCANTGTPYHRLQHRRATFDEVAALSVEGLNKSAIARVKRISWNTVDRWLERATDSCRRFNNRSITGLAVEELQADEIRMRSLPCLDGETRPSEQSAVGQQGRRHSPRGLARAASSILYKPPSESPGIRSIAGSNGPPTLVVDSTIELCTIVGGKQQPIWIFVSIDVYSRLWPSTVVGRRSYRNTPPSFEMLRTA